MTVRLICALFAASTFVSALFAQATLSNPVGQYVEYVEDSGTWDGPADGPASVYTHTVHVPGALWIRLFFSAGDLPAGSTIRMTSLLDGEVQELDAAGLAMWSQSSAYFNGDQVELELVAAPGSTGNRIALGRLEIEFAHRVLEAGAAAGPRGSNGICGICGADDRVQTNEQWSCRLMSVGCTASVFTTNSCLVSAGHCITSNLVAQFNVPNSNSSCGTVNPPVADQFPVTSTQQINGGVGNDWSVLRTGTNSLGQRPFQRYGKLRRIAPSIAGVSTAIGMWGYGLDTTCVRSQTQQFSGGPITLVTGSTYEFTADVRGGNSGSGLMKDGRIIGVVTHCRTGCPNIATRIDLPAFATARGALCPSCVADVNGDGIVDLGDLSLLLSLFGYSYPDPAFNPTGDLDADNSIDVSDLSLLLSQYGGTCN